MKARIITNLRRSPILNPPHIRPRSSPPRSLNPPPSSPISLTHSTPVPTFLPHLTLLACHPSLTLLTYPPSSYISHQSSSTSLIHLLISGRVRLIRDGALCVEVGRGGAVGVEEAVRGSEGYRRWRRRQRRRRQRRVREGVGVGDAEAEEDERELGLDVEELRGRKRRRVRVPHYCTVQCMEAVQCVVFPASVLLAYIESDRALRLHAMRWVMAVHCMRRGQWREAERRMQRLWGGPQTLAAPPTESEEILSPLEGRVRGSAGFARFGLAAAAEARAEGMRQWIDVEHSMFAYAAGEGGGPVERRRVRVKASGARGGDRAQKVEMRRVKETLDKAHKVRGIIDAMERRRREKAQAEGATKKRREGEDSMDSDCSDDEDEEDDDGEYEEEEDEDEGDLMQDERYAAAISQRLSVVMAGTVGRIRGRGTSPKLRLKGRHGDRTGGAARGPVSTVKPAQDPRVEQGLKPAWEAEDAKAVELRASVRGLSAEREERALKLERERPLTASPCIDRAFIRPGTPSTARLQRESTANLLGQWQQLDQRQRVQSATTQRRGREERRLEEEKAEVWATGRGEMELAAEPSLGLEALQPTDYARTRDRLQCREEEAKEVEVEAARVTAKLMVNELGVQQVEDRKRGGAARSAVRTLTEVEVMAIDAEQRFGRDERQLHRLLHWTSEQSRQVRMAQPPQTAAARPATAPAAATVAPPARPPPPLPQARPMSRRKARATEEATPQAGSVEEEAKTLFVRVEAADDGALPVDDDGPIALSPPSMASSPFHLLFPSHLTQPTPANPPRAHTSRPSSAAQPRSSTSTTPRSARPSSATPLRTALLSRQRRTAAVLSQSLQSLVMGAGKHELAWEVRLRLLKEAEALDVEREAAQQRLSYAPLTAAVSRESIAMVLSGAERVRRVNVSMGPLSAAVVCEPSGMRMERPHPARPATSKSMRKYSERMVRNLCG